MVEFQDFKKALGKTAESLSDEEIQGLNIRAEKLAQMLFEIWYATLKGTKYINHDE